MTDWKTDAQTGTPGPWKWHYPPTNADDNRLECVGGSVMDTAAYEHMWFSRYNDAEDAANMRRISRVPAYEEALRAAEAFERACDSELRSSGTREWYLARDAFREAMKKL